MIWGEDILAYNAIDLINKAVKLSIGLKVAYKEIGQQKDKNNSIKIMSLVLLKETDKAIEYYETLKKEIEGEEFDDIDFDIYDKMSFLVNEFNKKKYVREVKSVKEFLTYSIELEKDVQSLLIDIQGRFVKNSDDVNKKTYKTLGHIIKNKADQIDTLEKMIAKKF